MFYVQKIRESNLANITPNSSNDIMITITDENNIYSYTNSGVPFKITDVISYRNPVEMQSSYQSKEKFYVVESTKDIFYNNGSDNINILEGIKNDLSDLSQDLINSNTDIATIVSIINANYSRYEARLTQLEKSVFKKEFKFTIDLTLIQNGELEVPVLVKNFIFNDNQTLALTKVEATSLEDLEDITINVNLHTLTDTLLLSVIKNAKHVSKNVDNTALTYVNDGYYTVELTGLTETVSKFLNITLVFERKEEFDAEQAEEVVLQNHNPIL